MVTINGFIKHKTAGWTGVVFTSEDGKQYVTNAACIIWEYNQERQEKAKPVSASNESILPILRAWKQRTEKLGLDSAAPAGLLAALQACLGKEA